MQRRAKLGDIEFTIIEDEKPRDVVVITDNSVENGQDISDHVKQNPSIIDLYGQMIGIDAAAKLNTLKKYQREGKLLTYIGRSIYDNMAIQSIDRSHGKNIRNGFSFNITLKQVRIATAKEVVINIVSPDTMKESKQTNTQVKPKTNNGKQQPHEKKVTTIKDDFRAEGLLEGAKTPGGTIKAIIDIYKNTPKSGGGTR